MNVDKEVKDQNLDEESCDSGLCFRERKDTVPAKISVAKWISPPKELFKPMCEVRLL